MFRKWWIHVCGWELDQKSYWSHQYLHASPVVKRSQISLCWVCVRWWCPAGCNAFVNLWMLLMQLPGQKTLQSSSVSKFHFNGDINSLSSLGQSLQNVLSGMAWEDEKQNNEKMWIRQCQNALQAKMMVKCQPIPYHYWKNVTKI